MSAVQKEFGRPRGGRSEQGPRSSSSHPVEMRIVCVAGPSRCQGPEEGEAGVSGAESWLGECLLQLVITAAPWADMRTRWRAPVCARGPLVVGWYYDYFNENYSFRAGGHK